MVLYISPSQGIDFLDKLSSIGNDSKQRRNIPIGVQRLNNTVMASQMFHLMTWQAKIFFIVFLSLLSIAEERNMFIISSMSQITAKKIILLKWIDFFGQS